MATSASIDLVFSAKDNTQNVFKGLNKEIAQAKTVAEKATTSFSNFGQSVRDVADRSVTSLRQGFLAAQSVMQQAFAVGVAGAGSLALSLGVAGSKTLIFGRQFKESIIDPLLEARSFLENKSFLDIYTEQLVAASKEAVSFNQAFKEIGDSVVEFAKLGSGLNFKTILSSKPLGEEEVAKRLAQLEKEETGKLNDAKTAALRFGIPEPATVEAGIAALAKLQNQLKAKAAGAVLTDEEAVQRFGIPNPKSINAAVSSIEKLENQLRIKQAATGTDATATSKLRFQVDLFSQSVERAAGNIYKNFLPALGSVLDVIKRTDAKILETANSITTITAGLGGILRSAAGYDEAIAAFDGLKKSAGAFSETIGNVSQQIFFFQSAFQSITQIAASGPFKLLIGQQVQLRQQLLETQSTLVATNKIVSSSGEQLNRPIEFGGDPGRAIVALSGATEAAIKQLRKDSLELVGVTSNQLAEVFNITTTGLAATGIESENLLGESADLTIKFAAALGTIGLPLSQARQEISSILQGTTDVNSVLAKTLNISNESIRKYKEQGNLIEKLNEKLKPFQAGNAIAAKSLEGVTSNIREVFEIVTLEAGKPLLDPLLEGLNQFYQFLAANQGNFARFLEPVIQDILRIQKAVFEAAAVIGDRLGPAIAGIAVGIIRSAANFVEQLTGAISSTLNVLDPFVSILEVLVSAFGGLNNIFGPTILRLIVFGKTVQVLSGSINLFFNLLKGVGEIRYIIKTFTSGAVAQFFNLKKALSATSSAVVTFGLNFEALSRTFPAINKGLADSLGGFKAFAPAVAFLIPKLSVAVLGIKSFVSRIREVSGALIASIPKIEAFLAKFTLVGRIASFVAGRIVAAIIAIKGALTAAGFDDIAKKLDKLAVGLLAIELGDFGGGIKGLGNVFNGIGDAAEAGLGKVDNAIAGVTKNKIGGLTKAVVSSAVSFGLWSIAIAGAGIALSEFLQRRQDQGQNIRDISDSLTRQADAIKNIKSDNLKAFNERIKDGDELTKDWVDKIIILNRNFKLADLSFENFGETIVSIGQILAVFFSRVVGVIVLSIKNTVLFFVKSGVAIKQFFDGIIEVGLAAASSLLDIFSAPAQLLGRLFSGLAQAWEGDIAGAQETFSTLFKDIGISERTKQLGKDAGESFAEGLGSTAEAGQALVNSVTDGYSAAFGDEIGKTLTKVEVGLQQTAKEVKSGELAASAKELGRNLRENLVPNDAKFKTISASLAESVADIGSASATAGDRLNGVTAAIEQIRAIGDTGIVDPKSIQESITLLEDFRFETLDAAGNLKDASEEGKEAFDNQKTALRQALSLSLQQGRNIKLGADTDNVQAQLTAVTDELTKQEEIARANPLKVDQEVITELRRVKAELEGIVETYDTLRQDTQPLADPVQLYANSIQKNEALLKRLQSRLTLEQQEETQGVIASFLERRGKGELVFTRNLEQEKNKVRKVSLEKELGDIQKAVAEIQEKRDALTEFELERAEELDDQFTQLKTRQAQKQIELFEATIQEQQAVREEAERSIQEELQKTKNETEEIKLSVKEQELAYDGVLKKIDQQNALLNEGRKLVDAQAQSALSGLDFLKENARSASRQKALTETTAAIRLQSVREQIKFEEISLRLEQQKTELALQREAIAANISRLEAEAGLAQAQAELEKINLPGSEATVAERKAAEISVRAAAQQLRGTQQAERLIAEQATQQKTLFELQRRSFAVESANKERTARFAAASAIASPIRRRRAIRGLEEEESKRVAGLIGIDPNSFEGAAGFGRQLQGANLQFQRSEGFATGAPPEQFLAALEAISPEIADLTGAARDQAIAQAARQLAQSTPFIDQAATPLGIPTGQQFQLQTSQPAILQQLFTPVQNTLGLAATNIGKAAQGFDTLITELRAIAAKPTYNLTVTAGGSSLSTGGAATSTPDLQKVLATAKRLVTNGLF